MSEHTHNPKAIAVVNDNVESKSYIEVLQRLRSQCSERVATAGPGQDPSVIAVLYLIEQVALLTVKVETLESMEGPRPNPVDVLIQCCEMDGMEVDASSFDEMRAMLAKEGKQP